MTHELKTWPDPFSAILDGRKRYEIRKADRDFSEGDTLRLREWNEQSRAMPYGYTGREITVRVTYMSPGGTWGLPADLCVMSIAPLGAPAPSRSEETGDGRRAVHLFRYGVPSATACGGYRDGDTTDGDLRHVTCPSCRPPSSPQTTPAPEGEPTIRLHTGVTVTPDELAAMWQGRPSPQTTPAPEGTTEEER